MQNSVSALLLVTLSGHMLFIVRADLQIQSVADFMRAPCGERNYGDKDCNPQEKGAWAQAFRGHSPYLSRRRCLRLQEVRTCLLP